MREATASAPGPSAAPRITGRRAAEIAADVERAVGEGELPPGALLPPLRELASRLGVNPNTVAAAYRLLRDRGVIETAGRRGSRVLPRPALTTREAATLPVPPGARNLAHGNPAVDLLPDPAGALSRALGAAAAAQSGMPVRYGAAALEETLGAVARGSFAADGIPGGRLAVASGSLDAIERIFQAWLRPGDTVAVEDPGWASLIDLLPALGLRPVPVPVDDDGPLPAAVYRALADGARALVVTARAQNPTGAAVGAARAAELRAALADHQDVLLIEDDHGHGIVDLPHHPLCAHPGGSGAAGTPVVRHWAVARSAAKALGPDLRVAVVAGDAETVDRVLGRQRLGPGWVSHLLQRATAELWSAADPVAVGRAYGLRRDALLEALRARGVPAHGRSGLNVWVPVADETVVVAGLLARGWAVAPGSRYRLASRPGIRITTAELDPEDAGRLAEDVAAMVRPAPAAALGGRGI